MRLPAAEPKASDAQSCSFITKVQHLIETCLMFDLDQDECVKALQKHARIDPIITRTVWNELEKENKKFFEGYHCERVARKYAHVDRVVQGTKSTLFRQVLKDISKKVKGNIPK